MQKQYQYIERFLNSSDPFEMLGLIHRCFEESESHPKKNEIQSALGNLIFLLEVDSLSLAEKAVFKDKTSDSQISQGSDKKGGNAQRKECNDSNLERVYSEINEYRIIIFAVQSSVYLSYYGRPKPTTDELAQDIEKTSKKKRKNRKNRKRKASVEQPQSDVNNNGNNLKKQY